MHETAEFRAVAVMRRFRPRRPPPPGYSAAEERPKHGTRAESGPSSIGPGRIMQESRCAAGAGSLDLCAAHFVNVSSSVHTRSTFRREVHPSLSSPRHRPCCRTHSTGRRRQRTSTRCTDCATTIRGMSMKGLQNGEPHDSWERLGERDRRRARVQREPPTSVEAVVG